MTSAWFITGTDTEIGKTFVSCALLHVARARGLRAVGMKPVAAGINANGLNDDVEALCAASNVPVQRRDCNPYCLRAAVAPHIAATEDGVEIEASVIRQAFVNLQAQADVVIVEGVGGFCVPFSAHFDSADLAVKLALPVILVVGMRLGCINHALLTAEAIGRRGLKLAGWVANRIDPAMQRYAENLSVLAARLNAPLLGEVPYLGENGSAGGSAAAARFLRLPEAEFLAHDGDHQA